MTTAQRREKIMELLRETDVPISATAIAGLFSVSRQIIVGDIALLRAGGEQITATPRGYLLEQSPNDQYLEISIVCNHADEQVADELYTVVDLGGTLIDVIVQHSVYGQICAPLYVASRFDADTFLLKLQGSGSKPLCDLTDGIHLHRLRSPNAEVQQRVLKALEEKGYLMKKE
ncbi:MAG: transcription repressor NadR [Butyricicoccus sp.]|nr:transcription repressor NadR [Butyricicoccus sp.]MBQ8586016.1 transcription repressor NadR [Butyricicoccus sp.]